MNPNDSQQESWISNYGTRMNLNEVKKRSESYNMIESVT